VKAVRPFPFVRTAGSRPEHQAEQHQARAAEGIQSEGLRTRAGHKQAGRMQRPAVAPLGLRSRAVHMLAVVAYRRQAAVLVGQGIRMRLRLERVDRLEEPRPLQHLRQFQNRKPGRRSPSSSSFLPRPVREWMPVVVCHPGLAGHIAGRPGKGWPWLRCERVVGRRGDSTVHAMCIRRSSGRSCCEMVRKGVGGGK